MVSNLTQLLLRRPEATGGPRLLVVDAPRGDLLGELLPDAAGRHITCVHTNYFDYLTGGIRGRVANAEVSVLFRADIIPSEERYSNAVVYMPRERDLREWLLLIAASTLTKDGTLHAVGRVRAGAKTAARFLGRHFAQVEKLDAARHCVLYAARRPDSESMMEDVFADQAESFQAVVGRRRLTLCSMPGVFSHGRLDGGTRLLLETFGDSPDVAGRILDFGCGCGAIGAFLGQSCPDAQIELVDVSAFAIEAARRTVALNEQARCRIFPSDGFSDVRGQYDWIVSNPPFHTGVDTDYSVVETFLKQAAAHLTGGGRLRIVANRFLRYTDLIQNNVGDCKTLADDGAYRVYEARKGN